jgi:hypothetical protein
MGPVGFLEFSVMTGRRSASAAVESRVRDSDNDWFPAGLVYYPMRCFYCAVLRSRQRFYETPENGTFLVDFGNIDG